MTGHDHTTDLDPQWIETAAEAIARDRNPWAQSPDIIVDPDEYGICTAYARLALAAVVELIAERAAAAAVKADRERLMASLLHVYEVTSSRDRWDEGYLAGIAEAMHWVVPSAPTEPDAAAIARRAEND